MLNPKNWLQQVSDKRNDFFRTSFDIYSALEYTKSYSQFYNSLIEDKVSDASKIIFGKSIPKGVSIFSFGAPSRNEMMGKADADVAVYRANNSDKEIKFRESLVESLQEFKFTKVDTPAWGTLEDIKRYMTTSVTEANQVIEAQFICGDSELREEVEQLRLSLYDKESIAKNLVFQFFYFEQYFNKKASANYLNLKYCPGGTRDLLFPMWYAQLKKGVERDLQSTAIERGLNALYEDGLLVLDDLKDILKSASAIIFVRDEIMDVSPGDVDGKLSLQKTIEIYKKKPYLFDNPENIMNIVKEERPKVSFAKTKVWEGLRNYFCSVKSEKWNKYLKKALSKEVFGELPSEFEDDEIINTVRIWNFDSKSAEQSLDFIEKSSCSDSWIVLASLLSSPYISGDIIDSVIRRKGFTLGYEYFLEIAARNPKLKKETLEFIIMDDSIEPRFKKPALKLAKKKLKW